ncbi:MAG: hypothetical protein HYR50_09370 [Candidatus Rokubacteria bacterium]|nr:hypothetical protein [Candidatus Rokubacteria bacterium]
MGIRHWTFGCAMTLGASMMAAAAAAAITPPAVAMNLRRSVIMLTPSLELLGTMRCGKTEPRRPTQACASFGVSLGVTGPLTPRRDLGTSPERLDR